MTNIPNGDPGVASFASEEFSGREVFSGDTPVTSTTEVVGENQTLPIYTVVGRQADGTIAPAIYESSGGVTATGVLTFAANPTAGDTVTVGGVTYEHVAALSEDSGEAVANEVLIGASASDSLDNLIAAINGDDGVGVQYSTGTVRNELASAAAGAGDTMDVTAREIGTAGNDVATTETYTNVGNVFGAAALAGGTDFVGDGIKAMGITTAKVTTGDGETDTIDVYRSGMFDPNALNWHASFDTDAKKKSAFEGGVSPNIFIQEPKYS